MSKIISIETGTDICSVGLSHNGKLLSLRESIEGRNHTSDVALFLEEILQQNTATASDIDAVAVSVGPGSYTGLRVGVSFAKGFCYAQNIPMIAIDSLESLTRCAIEDSQSGIINLDMLDQSLLIPMIDARRMEVYTRVYDHHLNPFTEIEAKIIDNNSFEEFAHKNIYIFGSGAQKCLDVLPSDNFKFVDVAPSARGLVEVAHQKFDKSEFVDLAYYEPLYLKNFIGTKSQKRYF